MSIGRTQATRRTMLRSSIGLAAAGVLSPYWPAIQYACFGAGLGDAERSNDDGRYLLLDPRVVNQAEGVELVLGSAEKDPRNPLFGEDKPWEVRFDNLYANVYYDPNDRTYRCWYSPFIVDEATSATPRDQWSSSVYKPDRREMGVCFASSVDGIRWTKPVLEVVEFNGSRRNNIVARGQHGAGILRDASPSDTQRLYKMFAKDPEAEALVAHFSADGVHWGGRYLLPEIDARGDTHNNAFWAADLNKYVAFTRLWDDTGEQRLVGRTESTDFLHWTKAVEVLRAMPEEGLRQTYAMPVFRYGSLYLGLLMMLNVDEDTVDCELTRSVDTLVWERVCPGQSLIPRGESGSYDCGCIYAALSPIELEKDIRVYYGGSNGKHTGFRDGFFCLARLRPDGFAGMQAKTELGRVVTEPLLCTAHSLNVTADINNGALRVGVVGSDELTTKRAHPLKQSVTGGVVSWGGRNELHSFHGKPIQLVFEFESSTLYSFKFANGT